MLNFVKKSFQIGAWMTILSLLEMRTESISKQAFSEAKKED